MKIEIRNSFDDMVMKSDTITRKAVSKTLNLILSFQSITELWNHHGLHFEKLHRLYDPFNKQQIYSIRINQKTRAIVMLHDGPMITFISLHTQHDSTYQR